MTDKLNKLRCLIIDDDPMITDLIQHFCSKIPDIEFCLSCNNAIDGLKLLSSQNFDVLFLDYNMPDLTGKALLELKQDSSKVIMITSNPEFAVDSYNFDTMVDYLLKPIKFERFLKAVHKITSQAYSKERPEAKTHYFIKDGTKWIKVKLEDVFFIKSDSNYVIWQIPGKQIISLMKLKDLERELPDNFKRVHRSYIINTRKIESLTKDIINIQGNQIPVGNSYKDIVDEILSDPDA